jgi:hypothetical protein
LLVVGLTAGTITGAQASVAEKSAKAFCEKLVEISTTVPDVSGGDYTAAAREFQKLYKKLAKLAPTGKLRKAVKTTAKYYGRLAGGIDPNSAEAGYTDAEVAASTTITDYSRNNCTAP